MASYVKGRGRSTAGRAEGKGKGSGASIVRRRRAGPERRNVHNESVWHGSSRAAGARACRAADGAKGCIPNPGAAGGPFCF